ncbi:MAG TPA: hypothetical protein VGQ06_14585 [Gemmatimonadales bacterium]|jgi:hypothetical protein|nr:hypothetical protein [Gemmatimonadales bacterium]
MRGLWPVLLVVVGGCYRYVAVGGTAPSDGADVQLELAPPRDVVLQDVTVHGITALQGRLLGASADSVALAVVKLWGLEGRTYEATGIGVTLPRQGIAAVREKRMSAARSGLAIGASSAGVVAMILGVKGLLGSGGGSGKPKPMP